MKEAANEAAQGCVMWKSMPLWAMIAVPGVPFFALVVLQAGGAGDGVQKVAFVLFLAAIVYVSFAIRARKREAAAAPTPLKKLFLSFAVWLVLVFILALVWANGQAVLHVVIG
jgi:hypothetical protein